MSQRLCMIVQKDYLSDVRVRRYAESLADSGIEVDILCARGEDTDDASYRSDIKIFRIPIGHGSKSMVAYVFEFGMATFLYGLWLIGLQLRRRYDVIHIHNMPDCLVFSGLFPKLCLAKIVLDFHDPMPEFYASKFASNTDGWPIKLLRVQERFAAMFANRVIVANENFERNLVGRGVPASKITVVNNIADTKVFDRSAYTRQSPASSAGGTFTLLYPGTVARRYGLDVAIRSAVTLRDSIPNLLIRIVGLETDHTVELRELAENLEVSDLVEFVPGVPVHEVPQFMADADIGIYTARPDSHMSIATPTKVLEYMQMGLPVIASRLLILEQSCDDASIRYVDPGNVEEFTAAVLELWSDPTARKRLVENADQNFIRLRSWPKERIKYYGTLNELLGWDLPTELSDECQNSAASVTRFDAEPAFAESRSR